MRIRRLLCLVIAVLAVMTGTGADALAMDYGSGTGGGPVGTPVRSTIPYTNISDVMIVGDSITVRGYKDLAAALPGKRLAVDAQAGRNTADSIDSLFASMRAGMVLPPVLIMATGSNDVFDPFVMAAQVKRLLAGVPPGTRVYWVDVQVSRPATAVADQRNSAQVNRAIWLGCTGSCTVISWATFFAVKPARIGWYLDSGGVHPIMGVGTRAWAALIAGALR